METAAGTKAPREGRTPRAEVEHPFATVDLRERVARQARVARKNSAEFITFLRLLYELQDFDRYQVELRALIALIRAGRFERMGDRGAAALLRLAEVAALSTDEIAGLADAIEARLPAAGALAEMMPATRLRVRLRRAMEARYEGRFTLVSLGLNCLPWLVPNRWGLRLSGDFTAAYTPFALAKHRYGTLLDGLADDFAGYVPGDLMSIRTLSGFTIPARRDRGAVWNHNKGEFWSQDDFAELRRDLADKLSAFRASAAGPTPVFLLGDLPFRYPDEPIERLDELKAGLARFARGPLRLILMSQQPSRYGTTCLPVDEETLFLHCPYPSPDYVWQDEDTGNSPTGLAYERAIVGLLYRALIDWGVLRRRPRRSWEEMA